MTEESATQALDRRTRQAGASDRRVASQDRAAAAAERTQAEGDRITSLADRAAGAAERAQARFDRSTAHADRGAGAAERTQAEVDRTTAQADRGASARERDYSSADQLTGVYMRGPGFVELTREIARARRTGQPLVLAFIDVDGLKAVNDSRGHAAGDQVLRDVAKAVRTSLRSYDLILRYGGDEFVCAAAGLTMPEAARRFARVNAALANTDEKATVTIGLAELQPDESPHHLVARADAALYHERDQHPPGHPLVG